MYPSLSLVPRLSPLRRGRAGRVWERGYPSLIPRLRGRRQTFLFSHAAWVRGYMYPRLSTDRLLPCSLIYTMLPICLPMHYLFLTTFRRCLGKGTATCSTHQWSMKAYELVVHSAALSHLLPLRGWLCSSVVNRDGGTASDSLEQP